MIEWLLLHMRRCNIRFAWKLGRSDDLLLRTTSIRQPSEFDQPRHRIQGDSMLTRRHVIASALAAPAILRLGTGTAHAATTLKISHQFPGWHHRQGRFP